MKKIKGLILIIFTFICSIAFVGNVNAANANIAVTTNKSTVAIGSTVTVTVRISSSDYLGAWDFTLNYDSSKFSYVSGSEIRVVEWAQTATTKSKTYTYTFRARTSGSAKFNITSSLAYAMSDNSKMSITNGSRTVTIKSQAEIEASYSGNNNLASLSIEGYADQIAFNKDTLEYNVEVPSDITTIKINARRADSTASVSGSGEQAVTEGLNKFEIIVTAQNGKEKTYILNVNVVDPNPINVKVNGNEYTIVKKSDSMIKPQTFEEITIHIEGIEVPAFKSEKTGFTLIGLKDNEGQIDLYIYHEETDTYTKYIELTVTSIIFYPLNKKEELNYTLTKITINNLELEAYHLSEDSDYYLVYGMNIETGEESWYLYDLKENTLQRYDSKTNNKDNSNMDIYQILSLVFGGTTILCLIIITAQSNKYKKLNKKIDEAIASKVKVEENDDNQKKSKKK